MIDLSNKPVLIGNKVMLRPFVVEKDFVHLKACLTDPEVLKLTGSSGGFNEDTIRQWYDTRYEQNDRLDLAIVDKVKGYLVGEVVINEYDKEHHSMNFRILIGPHGRNHGLGTEATQLIVDYIFQSTDLEQLTLGVYAFNSRARKVYEKVGFVIESIDKNELEYEGEWVDAINMKLSQDNWLKKHKV